MHSEATEANAPHLMSPLNVDEWRRASNAAAAASRGPVAGIRWFGISHRFVDRRFW